MSVSLTAGADASRTNLLCTTITASEKEFSNTSTEETNPISIVLKKTLPPKAFMGIQIEESTNNCAECPIILSEKALFSLLAKRITSGDSTNTQVTDTQSNESTQTITQKSETGTPDFSIVQKVMESVFASPLSKTPSDKK